LILAIFFGLFKIQIFLAAIAFVVIVELKISKSMLGLFFLLVVPLLSASDLIITSAEFQDASPEALRSAALISFLEGFNKYPFGMVFSNIIKLVLNYLAGLNPLRVFGDGDLITVLQNYTTGFLSVFSILFAIKRIDLYRAGKVLMREEIFCLIFAFILVTPPFLQSRYFWWSIPLFLITILSRKDELCD
jgi:hypothetical protein